MFVYCSESDKERVILFEKRLITQGFVWILDCILGAVYKRAWSRIHMGTKAKPVVQKRTRGDLIKAIELR